jgi:membrane protease YdiL (CAAX protease family)
MNIFLNTQRQLRSFWWIAIFFLVLAAFTFPLIIVSQQYNWEITIHQQALIVVVTTIICQAMRKSSMSELVGKLNLDLLKNTLLGLVFGALLMLIPAVFLMVFGYIHWRQETADLSILLNLSMVSLSVAVAEEFLFRGFIFQRLRKSIGLWGAQLLMAGYFLLTHMGNPGMTGDIKIFASINIFVASIMFGFAYIKTNSLIMPIAFHFMANWVQGTLLGFGVSGSEQVSLLKPVLSNSPSWLTGGSFGLEASIPGLVCVIVITFILYRFHAHTPTYTQVNIKSAASP